MSRPRATASRLDLAERVPALTPRMPDLGALQVLVSVARLGSLAAAASEHGISQPAASSRVRYMEKLIGLPLVLRGATGSALTEHGQVVVGWARDLLVHAAAMDEALTSLRHAHQSRLRLACSSTIADFLLPTWLSATQRGITVEVMSTNSHQAMDAVLEGRADLGLVEGPVLRHGLTDCTVGTDRLVVVVGTGHPWAARPEPVSAQELAGTRRVQREFGSGTRAWLDAELPRVSPVAPAAWEGSCTAELLRRVVAGQAPAVLSEHVVRTRLLDGSLVEVPTTGLQLRRQLRAVWPFGQPLGPTSRNFLRDIRARSGGRPAAG